MWPYGGVFWKNNVPVCRQIDYPVCRARRVNTYYHTICLYGTNQPPGKVTKYSELDFVFRHICRLLPQVIASRPIGLHIYLRTWPKSEGYVSTNSTGHVLSHTAYRWWHSSRGKIDGGKKGTCFGARFISDSSRLENLLSLGPCGGCAFILLSMSTVGCSLSVYSTVQIRLLLH